jgi:prepilin-type N-terminal cleavage/methylation domain-containing protein
MKRFAFTFVELLVVLAIIAVMIALKDAWFLFETPFYLFFGRLWGLWRRAAGLVH